MLRHKARSNSPARLFLFGLALLPSDQFVSNKFIKEETSIHISDRYLVFPDINGVVVEGIDVLYIDEIGLTCPDKQTRR